MRYFNTHGPVNAAEHYVVARRALVEGLAAQIEQGKYFTIYAPRQMGKTTLLRALDAELDAQADFLSIDLTFEAYESWSPADFWADFGERISYHISTVLQSKVQESAAAIQLVRARPFMSIWCGLGISLLRKKIARKKHSRGKRRFLAVFGS